MSRRRTPSTDHRAPHAVGVGARVNPVAFVARVASAGITVGGVIAGGVGVTLAAIFDAMGVIFRKHPLDISSDIRPGSIDAATSLL